MREGESERRRKGERDNHVFCRSLCVPKFSGVLHGSTLNLNGLVDSDWFGVEVAPFFLPFPFAPFPRRSCVPYHAPFHCRASDVFFSFNACAVAVSAESPPSFYPGVADEFCGSFLST